MARKYLLTEQFQSPKDGKIIETDLDVNIFKDVDKFFKALAKEGTLTKEESNKYSSVYYEEYIDAIMASH